ncbi:MAG: ABC transporter ATP-binding protein, partial [Chloroflexi bacterium]|nr:ABC transporter ATP-binding protein [Chloroflexota bacterium]
MYSHQHWGGGGRGGDDDLLQGRVYDQRVVSRLLGYLRPHKTLVLVGLVAMLLYTGTLVAIPRMVGYSIDTFIARKDLAGLNVVAIILIIIALANYVTNYIQLMSLARVNRGVILSLRTQMFNHLQGLSLSFFDRNQVGRLMSRAQNDVQELQEFLTVLVTSVGDVLSLAGIIVVMLAMDLSLALVTLGVIPVLLIIMVVWQGYARRTYMRVRRAIAIVNAGLQENISGVRVVQSLNRQDTNLQRFDRTNYDHLDANLQAARLSSALWPSVEILTAVALGMVIIFGGIKVLNGDLQVGILVTFAMYIQRFFDPIRQLTLQYAEFQRAMTSGSRVFELLDTTPEVKDAPGAQELPPIQGHVRFQEVTFSYQPGVDVLRNV